ncbi:hypothetical protein, partial [Sodalis sp. (in: enterobacteria)]|uniref:hypothetical protein n=1 Tax=Sodalis sp. (in: enterobacteria) TaxID=1898979 RepID=UPI003F4121E3
CCVWATLLKPDVARSGKGNSPVPCTAWADQKWSTIPRSYLADKGNNPAQRGNPCCLRSRGMRVNGSSAARVSDAQAPWGATDA